MEPIKYITIEEFIEQGFLQEANRLFFHPLGLVLAVDREAQIFRVKDYRDDPGGRIFNFEDSDQKRLDEFLAKAKVFGDWQHKMAMSRFESCGFVLEPIPLSNNNKDQILAKE